LYLRTFFLCLCCSLVFRCFLFSLHTVWFAFAFLTDDQKSPSPFSTLAASYISLSCFDLLCSLSSLFLVCFDCATLSFSIPLSSSLSRLKTASHSIIRDHDHRSSIIQPGLHHSPSRLPLLPFLSSSFHDHTPILYSLHKPLPPLSSLCVVIPLHSLFETITTINDHPPARVVDQQKQSRLVFLRDLIVISFRQSTLVSMSYSSSTVSSASEPLSWLSKSIDRC